MGTKQDLRENKDTLEKLAEKRLFPITSESGVRLQREIGAMQYIECSALTGKGVKGTFDVAIRTALANRVHIADERKRSKERRGSKCVVL